ncbi:hypothetical protein SEPCBS57363_003361 [Sporothrix epigloea]|uniref:Uncharacterized protein n=1 Tax=Sporothrix epigloea TaxID=1892477 RepID=A0ABP0DL15_9PEZI
MVGRRWKVLVGIEQNIDSKRGKTNGGREEVRKAIMGQDWHLLNESQVKKAKDLLANPLRSCHSHFGQAYSNRDVETNAYGIVGCRYLCKMAIGYQEAEVDDLDKAKTIDLYRRRKCPSSCAEVVTSGWCDELSTKP